MTGYCVGCGEQACGITCTYGCSADELADKIERLAERIEELENSLRGIRASLQGKVERDIGATHWEGCYLAHQACGLIAVIDQLLHTETSE